MVGASLLDVTVSRNDVVFVPLSASVTVRVIVVEPNLLAAGVTRTVRFAPVPENEMLPFGTSVVFDDVPLTVRFAAAVSMSLIVKLRSPVSVSSAML